MENDYNKIMKKLIEKEKQITKIIETRREKAIEQKIFRKIVKILDILGDEIQDSQNSLYYRYQDKIFTLNMDSNYYQVDLDLNAMEHDYVFRGRSDDPRRIDLYIPEKKWEDHLKFVYKKALITEKNRELVDIKKKQKKLIKEWQITEEELS